MTVEASAYKELTRAAIGICGVEIELALAINYGVNGFGELCDGEYVSARTLMWIKIGLLYWSTVSFSGYVIHAGTVHVVAQDVTFPF